MSYTLGCIRLCMVGKYLVWVTVKIDHLCGVMGIGMGKLLSEKRNEQIARKLVYDV
ncbi:hypothetical protein [Anaplasma phagocytophilum]|uniref:hypothetical protein n=1 Tax=Anaplasma phagocytophilum TaxID=948 RepID=UPI00201AE20E